MAKRAAGKAGKASKTPGAAGGTVKPKHSNDKNRANKDVKTGMRSSGTVRRLAMYNSKPVRNKQGKIVKYELQSRDLPSTRIQPDRRWFGNTRVVGQKQLEAFREEMAVKAADPYTVVLDARKLPLGLIQDPETTNGGLRKATARATRSALVATQPFAATFGKEARRKRPKLAAES
ncbi:NGP1NT domain-containing protein, partial [Helicosporidium sp. ATCC 50920]